MKQGIGVKRRIAGLCSLLVLHAIGMSGGSVMAQGMDMPVAVTSTLTRTASAARATMPQAHCADAAKAEASAPAGSDAALTAAGASDDTSSAASDCSGCCKVQHACPGSCACPASAANVSTPFFARHTAAHDAATQFAATAHPPQPPLRIFRPPIA